MEVVKTAPSLGDAAYEAFLGVKVRRLDPGADYFLVPHAWDGGTELRV